MNTVRDGLKVLMKSLLRRILHGWQMILIPYQRRRKIINNLAGQQCHLKTQLQKQRKEKWHTPVEKW